VRHALQVIEVDPRTLRRRRGWALLVLAAFAAAACGGGSDSGAAQSTSTTEPRTTTTRATACEADDRDPRELEPVMVAEVGGFRRSPDEVGDTGPSDLAKAIRDDGQPDAEAVLEGTGFRRGYQRLWANDADEELVLFLYEFCKADGAEQYAGRAAETLAELGVLPIDTGGVGTGFMVRRPDLLGIWVAASEGPALVQAIAYAGSDADAAVVRQRAVDLVVAQLARLELPDTSGAA